MYTVSIFERGETTGAIGVFPVYSTHCAFIKVSFAMYGTVVWVTILQKRQNILEEQSITFAGCTARGETPYTYEFSNEA